MSDKSNLVIFAENELSRLGKDEGQEAMNKHLLQMVEVFADEGHSGCTAMYAIRCLERLLCFLPLTEIEDKPEDWTEVSDGLFQHKRCSSVFKDKKRFDGQAYNVDGRVFSSGKSKVPIDFPYFVPLHPAEYLVDENGEIVCEYSR